MMMGVKLVRRILNVKLHIFMVCSEGFVSPSNE